MALAAAAAASGVYTLCTSNRHYWHCEHASKLLVSTARISELPDLLGFPIVLKIPDGSFSRGIVKVETPEQLKSAADDLFQHTALVLAQEFMFTEFDWRVGILDGQALYACQYYMSRGHWQIYNHAGNSAQRSGGFKTLPVRDAPNEVV